MKKVFIILILSFISNLHAFEAQVLTDPAQPVKGTEYDILFKIKGQINETPFISFTPRGTEIIEKSNSNVSIKSVLINGQVKTERELTIVYKAMSEKSGTVKLSDIRIEADGEVIRLNDLSYKVGDQEMRAQDIFVQAELSKENLFIGEGVEVNFFLYSRKPILTQELKKFPQLNKFLKRFRNIQPTKEMYRIGNDTYVRYNVYSARLFPQSIDNVMIDPISLSIQYEGSSYSPFGGLGFQITQPKAKDISSKIVKITVSPLPAQGVPPDFTGLVGKHEISFKGGREKYIANDIIEFTLEVTGDGALENMSTPKLLSSDLVEEFEVKSDITELPNGRAKKVFYYTYIARKNGEIPQADVQISFFDPEVQQYYSKTLTIPRIVIAGASSSSSSPTNPSRDNEAKQNSNQTMVSSQIGLLAPYFSIDYIKHWPLFQRQIATFLFAILLMISLLHIVKIQKTKVSSLNNEVKISLEELRKQQYKHETLFKLAKKISGKDSGATIEEMISKSSLDEKSKTEFLKLLESVDRIFSSNQINVTKPIKPSRKLITDIVKQV